MNQLKICSIPVAQHLKLFVKQAQETDIEKKFMQNFSYASMVGSMMYAMVCLRPDLIYPVSLVSRFMSNSGKPHWHAIKNIL